MSLTDMVKHFEGGSALIEQWLKNKDTVLFLGVWEQLNNPGFNSLEFEGIKNEAGRNSFYLSAKKWIEFTDAIGLHAKAGRYGGTFAHRDIAFQAGDTAIWYLTREGVARHYGVDVNLVPQGIERAVGLTLWVDSLSATQALLARNDVPVIGHGNERLVIAPAHTQGVLLGFAGH